MNAALNNLDVVLIEDDPVDVESISRALKRVDLPCRLQHFWDGDSALDALLEAVKNGRGVPAIVLLDLNLPRTDGRAVLRSLRKVDAFKKVPIVILTSSRNDRDVAACYEAGANSYVQKPVAFDGFVDAMRAMKTFWFETAVLPT